MKALLIAALAATAVPAQAAIVTTDFGLGADAHIVSNDVNSNFGASTQIAVKRDAGSPGVNRLGYIRFDLSGLDDGDITSAVLSLTFATAGGLAASTIYELRGVSDDSWVETEITFNNAPGAGDLLQTFEIPTTASDVGTTFDISAGGSLLAFLNAQDDDLLSLRLWRVSQNFGNDGFASREHPTLAPPTLMLTQASVAAPVPEPATWAMLILGFGAAGAALRRRRAAPA